MPPELTAHRTSGTGETETATLESSCLYIKVEENHHYFTSQTMELWPLPNRRIFPRSKAVHLVLFGLLSALSARGLVDSILHSVVFIIRVVPDPLLKMTTELRVLLSDYLLLYFYVVCAKIFLNSTLLAQLPNPLRMG